MLSHETRNNIETFVKRHSDNNIIGIENIIYQAYTGVYETKYINRGLSTPINIDYKIILELRCRDNSYFEGVDQLGKMIFLIFKNQLPKISEIIVRYNYSNYCCKD